MSSKSSFIINMKLFKLVWREILKTVAYLKNKSPIQIGLSFYKKANGDKQNLEDLFVISLRAEINILKKQKNKFNNKA